MKLYQTLISLSVFCIGICISHYFTNGLSDFPILFAKCFFTYVGGLFNHWMWVTNK